MITALLEEWALEEEADEAEVDTEEVELFFSRAAWTQLEGVRSGGCEAHGLVDSLAPLSNGAVAVLRNASRKIVRPLEEHGAPVQGILGKSLWAVESLVPETHVVT